MAGPAGALPAQSVFPPDNPAGSVKWWAWLLIAALVTIPLLLLVILMPAILFLLHRPHIKTISTPARFAAPITIPAKPSNATGGNNVLSGSPANAGGQSHPMHATQLVGSPSGTTFQRVLNGNQPVIGFKWVTQTHAPGQPDPTATVIRTLEPLATAPVDTTAKTKGKTNVGFCIARDGYAVGGIKVDADSSIHAVQVIFMRYQNGQMITTDQYTDTWIGTPTGNPTTQLAGDGSIVYGLIARREQFLISLGLMVGESKKP